MAHSLAERCTPLKREYDTCFNAWFEGYLEPAVAATPATRKQYSSEKAAEYERNCGKIWTQYKECVQVAGFLRLLRFSRVLKPKFFTESRQGEGSRRVA